MFDSEIIVTALVGVFTSFASGFAAWFFAKKKYNSEVDSIIIRNMQASLEFYQKLSDDNKSRLDQVLKRNENLENEVKELKRQLMKLATSICTDLTCQLRQSHYKPKKDKQHEKTI